MSDDKIKQFRNYVQEMMQSSDARVETNSELLKEVQKSMRTMNETVNTMGEKVDEFGGKIKKV